jgi:CheY-like chemotaxis protein
MGGRLGDGLGNQRVPEDRRLVLLVDHDVASRRQARHLLELQGLEVVQASNGIAALELVQRLPQSFRLVITELDLPGVSGLVLIETLRMFRPDLTALCMSSRAVAGIHDGRRCLSKPLDGRDLAAALQDGAGMWEQDGQDRISQESIARARARYAMLGDLVEAALELSRTAGPEGAI